MIDENNTNRRTGVFSESLCSTDAASSLGRNMVFTSSSVMSLSSTAPPAKRGQVDPVQWRKVGPEPFEQRGHRGFVRRIGSNLDELRSRPTPALVASSSSRGPARRDTATIVAAPISASWRIRSGPTLPVAPITRWLVSPSSLVSDTGGCSPLKAWNMADTARYTTWSSPSAASHLGLHILRDQLGRHRVVDIDDAAPDFGMLQRQRAAQAPEDRVRRVRPITFVDRLGIAGERSPVSAATPSRQALRQAADRVEQAVTRGDIEAGDGTDGA